MGSVIFIFIRSAHDEIQDLTRKRDDDTACNGQKTVGTLRSVVALECKADLHDAEREQDDTDGADQPEDEFGQIVDDGDRIGRVREGGGSHAEHEDDGAEDRKDLLGSIGELHVGCVPPICVDFVLGVFGTASPVLLPIFPGFLRTRGQHTIHHRG